MRIAYFANGHPPEVGGVPIFNVVVARELRARGHEVTLVTWPLAPGADEGPIHRIDWPEKGEPDWKRLLPPLVAGADVAVVSRTSRTLARFVPALAAQRVPVVALCHGLRLKHSRRGWLHRFFSRRRFGFDRARLVAGVSRSIVDQIADMGVDRARLRVVHPGVDAERFRPDLELRERTRRELGLGDRTVLLTVSRLTEGKGHERVIRLLPRLREVDPRVVYLIAGDGGIRSALEELARGQGVLEHVRFLGHLPDPRPAFAAASVFAHPSNRSGAWLEAFGIATLEAAACGLPAIASRSGGARDIIDDGKTGLLVDEEDQRSLEEALVALVRDPELRSRLGAAAREKVVAELTWTRTVDALESVLREAAAREPRP